MSQRPRPKTRLAIDPDNAYGKLGASPHATTDELKKLLSDKRGKAMAARRARGQQTFGDEEAEIIELQAIEKEIGTAAARAAYDREHPQNVLLTVQPSPRDRAFEASRTAGLVTAWLAEELGPDALLLHPDAYWLWLPGGLDPDLARELAPFTDRSNTQSQTPDHTLDLAELK
ncbi:MAG TPA: hypothetical protein VGM88_00770 [Kofleriaceae bacterium]|jgi:hypothetical protein